MGWWAALGQQAASGAVQGGMDLGVNVAGQAIGNRLSRNQMKKTWKQRKKEMRFQQQLAMEYWDATNVEAQVEHLKNAGLSTGLMYGGSGAGGSNSQPSPVNTPQMGMGMTGVRMQSIAEINLMNAQADKAKAEAEKLRGADTAATLAGIEKLKQDTNNAAIQGQIATWEAELKRIAADTAKLTQQETIRQIMAATDKLEGEAKETNAKANIAKETQEAQIQQIRTASTEQALRIAAQRAGLLKTQADTAAVNQSINVMASNILKMGADTMQGWEKLSQSEREVKVKEMMGEIAGAQAEFNTSTPQAIKQWTEIVTDILGTFIKPK